MDIYLGAKLFAGGRLVQLADDVTRIRSLRITDAYQNAVSALRRVNRHLFIE